MNGKNSDEYTALWQKRGRKHAIRAWAAAILLVLVTCGAVVSAIDRQDQQMARKDKIFLKYQNDSDMTRCLNMFEGIAGIAQWPEVEKRCQKFLGK